MEGRETVRLALVIRFPGGRLMPEGSWLVCAIPESEQKCLFAVNSKSNFVTITLP